MLLKISLFISVLLCVHFVIVVLNHLPIDDFRPFKVETIFKLGCDPLTMLKKSVVEMVFIIK
jgi:hypothetical protein